ncbi:TatD family hydrolase [Sneathia sp. DSM 16631]|uniref:phosphotriesterase family protein n=1 Tax=Sneathia TaxID=168808 RepID=UPI001868F5FC|nr:MULTISPECIES: TatD family hydrolase [Sneathia]MBE3031172.1 TatD family hydrolase [Sneathia sp. DSM 16631]MDK9581590.1 TatD family hydrolase [Sneathia vaginalis]
MLQNGYTLMHEHMTIDLSGQKHNLDCKVDCIDEITKEMKKLYSKGVRNIVEVTNRGMGRNVKNIVKISKESGINFICSTGFYKEPFLPDYVYEMDKEEIAELLINDIEIGIDGTGIKAQLLGEIGTSKDHMTKEEEKIFESVVIAHKKTGVPISTHTTLGTNALGQIEFFEKNNVDLSKVNIGHVDLSGDIQYIIEILSKGVYISFDTIGKNNYLLDSKRVEMLKILQDMNLLNKVFLSQDISRKSNMEFMGGIGYSYIFDSFIPMLKEKGITDESLDLMLHKNPMNFFNK